MAQAAVATKKESKTSASKSNSALMKLEPNPQAKTAAKEKPAETPTTQETKAEKPKTTTKKKATASAKPKDEQAGLLDLGSGFSIKHKPRSAYSTLYQVVAKKGNFAKVAEALAAKKYDVSDKAQADELLASMLVPVDKLEDWCRADESWQEHAKKKTDALKGKVTEGDKQAKLILENKARCSDGKKWSGNIPEMISTCVGYYNFLLKPKKAKKPNKNVKKFQDAKVVFRRFDWEDKSFVMMFPEDHINLVKKAIEVSRGVKEDSKE